MTRHRFNIRSHFESLRASLESECTACGYCIEQCPIFGRGKLAEFDAEEIAAGRVAMLSEGVFSEEAYIFARACLRCGACSETCPVEIDAALANHVVRLAAAEGDAESSERYAGDTAGLQKLLPTNPTNPFRMLQVLQTRAEEVVWHTEIPENPPQVDVLLFLSCVGMARPDRIRTLIDLFELAGVSYAAIGGLDFCCGLLDALAGDLDTAQQHFDKLADAVEAFGARELVSGCPSCYGWFSDLARAGAFPFAFRHTTQLLAERLDDLPPRQRIEARVTVHDPCHFGREPGESEPSRELIAAVPGMNLVEMPRNRAETACCGGPAMGYQPKLGRQLTAERVREAARAGADTILSPCSGCISSLESAARAEGLRSENVIEPLARALGVEHEDPLGGLLAGDNVEEVLQRAAGNLWEQTHPREEVERFVENLIARRKPR